MRSSYQVGNLLCCVSTHTSSGQILWHSLYVALDTLFMDLDEL